jgi:hypothetical protein
MATYKNDVLPVFELIYQKDLVKAQKYCLITFKN